MKNTRVKEIVELNIIQIFLALLRKCWVILLSVLICGSSVYYISANWITPRYESDVVFYVNNASFASDNRLSASDLYASENLMGTYMVILNSGTTMQQVLEYSGVEMSREDVNSMLTVRTIEETVLFRVTVNGTDPEQVGAVALAISEVLPERINSVLDGAYISIADQGVLPTLPATPNVKSNTFSAILFGFTFGASLIVLYMLHDTVIREEKDIPSQWNLYVLTSVPEGKTQKKRKNKQKLLDTEDSFVLTPQQDEAYKFLRTNLMTGLETEDGCRVIGITSAMAGEGKSTTAANLARSLAVDGQQVLLMDCDLRRPTIYKRLHIMGRPGITDMLAGHVTAPEIMKNVSINESTFHVLTAGTIPPNPAELLNSGRMQENIQQLRQVFQWIILDLPPLGEVSDALAVSKNVDAYILVARRNRCQRGSLKAVLQELIDMNCRVLGVILNCTKK